MKITKRSVLSEINVTPFVDVMLVLLVVFIITAPMIIPGIDLDLPIVNSQSTNPAQNTEIIVSVTRGGETYLQDLPVKLLDLKNKIKEKAGEDEVRVFIRGDKDAPYEIIVGVLSHLKDSGFAKISLVTSES